MTTRVARLPSNRGDWQDPERVIKKKCLREIFFLCVCVGYITFMDWYQRSAVFHRAGVKAVLVLMPILGLTWLCGVLVPFSIIIAYIFILLNSLQVHFTHLSLSHDLSLSWSPTGSVSAFLSWLPSVRNIKTLWTFPKWEFSLENIWSLENHINT